MNKRLISWTAAGLFGLMLSAMPGGCGCGDDDPTPEPGVAPPAGTGINVTNPAARACDVLLRVSGDEVPVVRFSDRVTGQAIPKAPRLALSFVASGEASLVGQELAALIFETADQSAEIVEATCYDGQGTRLEGEPLRLD